MKMKKSGLAILLVMALALTGCGTQSTVKVVTEEKTYPEPDEVVGNLESAGFTVERYEEFEELDIVTTRIKASNGDDYLDICYYVGDDADIDAIVEYYIGNYKQYNLVSDSSVVYCYSGDDVVDIAGLTE